MTTTFLPRLNNCGLAVPTGDDVRTAIRTMDPQHFESIWLGVCRGAGVNPETQLISLDQLDEIAFLLTAMGGAVGLAGRALSVRIDTYRAFASRELADRGLEWGRKTQERLVFNRIPTRERMAEVARLDLFSPQAKYRLDAAARRVADLLHTKVGLVNALVEGAELFVGTHGLSAPAQKVQGSPIEWAMCSTMVRTRESYVVNDCVTDVIERRNPGVVHNGIAAYAGVPLITKGGYVIGSVCAIDTAARAFDESDVAKLQRVAVEVMNSADPERRFG